MTEERLRKFTFICMDKDCIETRSGYCNLSLYAENEPEHPSYCPYEHEPDEHKFKKWVLVKE